MRGNTLVGLVTAITIVSQSTAQVSPAVLIKVGEVLIGILSPLVTDYLKNVIQGVGTRPSAAAKTSLTRTSEVLGRLDESHKVYASAVTAYVHDLDTGSRHAADSKTYAGVAAADVLQELTELENAIKPLNGQKAMFDQNTNDLFEEYRNAKGQNIKELADLATKSAAQRKAFSDRLNANSVKFGEAIQAIRQAIQNKVNQ
jgi:hypothetical protein